MTEPHIYPRGFAPVGTISVAPTLNHPTEPPYIALDDLLATIPGTPLVKAAELHLKEKLPEHLWNHSIRTYLLAVAVAKAQFPETQWDPESLYLASLFHDLGCTAENVAATELSFELHGAFLARSWLAPDYSKATQDEKDIADSVAEAIARHTDFVEGKCTAHTYLLQVGTHIDNIGHYREWLAPATITDIMDRFPRAGWTRCLFETLDRELTEKPWCHMTFYDRDWKVVPNSPSFGPVKDSETA